MDKYVIATGDTGDTFYEVVESYDDYFVGKDLIKNDGLKIVPIKSIKDSSNDNIELWKRFGRS